MARHDGQRLVVVIEALLLAHVCQAMLNILIADAMEIETLAAREDGLQNLLRVGGAQHKRSRVPAAPRVLSSALNAAVVSMWTSSMI